MKATAILNNYQKGSYAYKVMSQKIESEERIDTYHTKITYNGLSNSDFTLLKRMVKNAKVVE